jgi:hypothetical protein
LLFIVILFCNVGLPMCGNVLLMYRATCVGHVQGYCHRL